MKKLLRKKLALMLLERAEKKKRPYYCEVEYLENTAKNWINTNFIPTNENVKWETCVSFNSTRSGQLMGSGFAGNSRFNFGVESSKFRFGFGGSWYDADTSVYTPDTNKHVWILDGSAKTGTIDGVSATFTQSYKPNGGEPIALFARSMTPTTIQDANWSEAKIYYSKIWSEGVLVRDFIPVLDWDMTPCMYDKVSGELFYNQGTGEFSYGREIHYVDYLESTGTQYVDTGITQNSNIKAELSVYPTKINKFIFGSRISAGRGGFCIFMHSNNGGSWYPFFNAATTMIPGFVVNEKYDIEFSKDGLVVNKQFLEGPYTSVFTGTLNIYLFAMNSNGAIDTRLFIGKIYSTKLWDNNILIRDYLPAIDENGVGFMFDRVSHTIFDNAGTGLFKYPAVELEYLESNGTQYIDTGYFLNTNTDEISIDYTNTSEQNYKWMFGEYESGKFFGVTSQTVEAPRFAYGSIILATKEEQYFTKHTLIANSDGLFNDGVQKSPFKSFEGSWNIYLFALNNSGTSVNGYFGYGKIYSYTHKRNGSFILDLIPALKDGQIGMYDKVTDVFFPNIGTGKFLSGKIVERG